MHKEGIYAIYTMGKRIHQLITGAKIVIAILMQWQSSLFELRNFHTLKENSFSHWQVTTCFGSLNIIPSVPSQCSAALILNSFDLKFRGIYVKRKGPLEFSIPTPCPKDRVDSWHIVVKLNVVRCYHHILAAQGPYSSQNLHCKTKQKLFWDFPGHHLILSWNLVISQHRSLNPLTVWNPLRTRWKGREENGVGEWKRKRGLTFWSNQTHTHTYYNSFGQENKLLISKTSIRFCINSLQSWWRYLGMGVG